jgi:hypothetical protein
MVVISSMNDRHGHFIDNFCRKNLKGETNGKIL